MHIIYQAILVQENTGAYFCNVLFYPQQPIYVSEFHCVIMKSRHICKCVLKSSTNENLFKFWADLRSSFFCYVYVKNTVGNS